MKQLAPAKEPEWQRRMCKGKIAYGTAKAALFFGDVFVQRAYRCPVCEKFHLTTKNVAKTRKH